MHRGPVSGTRFRVGPPRPGAASRRRRYSLWLAVACVPLLVGIVFTALAPTLRAEARVSSFTQAHGARRSAVIVSVHNIAHVTKHGNSTGPSGGRPVTYTAEVTLSLAQPVSGQDRTTLFVPGYDRDAP